MKCENYFCVYEKDCKCILDSISLDVQGSCLSCVYVNIDDDILQRQKNKFLIKQEGISNVDL